MTRRLLGVCAGLALAAMHAPVRSQSPAASRLPVALQPGETITGQVGPDSPDVYALYLAAGEHADVQIDQTAGDIRGQIIAPGGAASAFNNNESDLGTEHVVVAADRAGEHRIEVRSHAAPARPYALTVVKVAATTPRDLERVAVQSLLQRAREAGERRPAVNAEAVGVAREARDPRFLLAALMELGRVEAFRDRRLARAAFGEALELARTLNEPLTQESVFNDLGVLDSWLGEPRRSIAMMEQAFALARARDPALRVPLLHHNISTTYRDLGDADRALRSAREALSGWREEGSPGAQAYALRNIGWIYMRLGDTDRALEHAREALRLFRSVAYDHGIAIVLDTLGAIHVSRGQFDEAIALQKEAGIHWRRTKDLAGEGRTHLGIGMTLAAKRDPAAALVEYAQALPLFRKAGLRPHEADALAAIGEARESTGDAVAAASAFTDALALYRAIENGTGTASALFGLARLARDGGRLHEARARIEEAITLVEAERAGVSSTDLRAFFLASKRQYYDFYVDLLIRLHARAPQAEYLTAALVASERGRARALFDLLAGGGASIRAGVRPDLVEAERRAQERVTAKARLLTQILSGRPDREAEAAARRELSDAAAVLDEARAALRADSPSYAGLTQPRPLDVPALQRDFLDRETTLIEYALGDDASFAWVVTPTTITGHRLPARAAIEAAARDAHRHLAASHRRTAAAQARVAMARLSDQILRPLASRLTSRRLVIVPDGALHYVPFAALPDPRPRRTASGQPLIVRSEVVVLPSAAVAVALRSMTLARRPAAKAVAVLADPVLDAADPRVSASRPAIGGPVDRMASAPDDLIRSARNLGVARFERLPSTADEADAIARAGRGDVLRALDFDASRGTATSGILADYRIVHFATHALINSRHPELSGLVLSLVGRDGTPEDGFLRLHDVYNLRLSADLVVLSACRTGLGRQIAGEGLMGLTRGFMYAGAPRVVATLWDVRDKATSVLMSRFYTAMFDRGLSPAAALRAAQLSLLAEPARAAPVYWAAFTLQGDWK